MARSPDPKKLALWRARFQHFFDSGLAVARFCAVEQVSESSFYYREIKGDVRSIKITMGVDILRRKTPEMARKEMMSKRFVKKRLLGQLILTQRNEALIGT